MLYVSLFIILQQSLINQLNSRRKMHGFGRTHRGDHNDSTSYQNQGEIMKDKNIVGQAFQNANQLKKQDFEEDKLEDIMLSDELLKLARHDVQTYKKRLEQRLQDPPDEWLSIINPLRDERNDLKKELKRLQDEKRIGLDVRTKQSELMNKVGEFGLSSSFSKDNPIPIDVIQNVHQVLDEIKNETEQQIAFEKTRDEYEREEALHKLMQDQTPGAAGSRQNRNRPITWDYLRQEIEVYLKAAKKLKQQQESQNEVEDLMMQMQKESRFNAFKVSIFELSVTVRDRDQRRKKLDHGTLSVLPYEMAFAKLKFHSKEHDEYLDKIRKQEQKKQEAAKGKPRRAGQVQEVEITKVVNKPTEFYNMYQMYKDNGINSNISLNRQLMENFMNQRSEEEQDAAVDTIPEEFSQLNAQNGPQSYLQSISDGYLMQKKLIDDDFLALKDGKGFERLLIFDRPKSHDDLAEERYGKQNINLNKRLFMRLFHSLMTLIVHADSSVQGYFGIVKPVLKPRQEIKDKNEMDLKSKPTDFQAKNAIVAIDYIEFKPPQNPDDIMAKRKSEFPFYYWDPLHCDLTKQSVFINLILQDSCSLKSQQMNIILVHAPQVSKLPDQQQAGKSRSVVDATHILQRSLTDRQYFPDVFANMVDTLNNGLDYISMTQPDVHCTIFDRIRLLQSEDQITSILNSRKRVFEAIMSKIHFCQTRRGASKNFWKWLFKHYNKLEKMTSRQEDATRNVFEKIKIRLSKIKSGMNISSNFSNWLLKQPDEKDAKKDDQNDDSLSKAERDKNIENVRDKVEGLHQGIRKAQEEAAKRIAGDLIRARDQSRQLGAKFEGDMKKATAQILQNVTESRVAWYRTQEKQSRLRFEMESLSPFIELQKAYLDTIESSPDKQNFDNKKKERLYAKRLDLLNESSHFQKELHDFANQIRFRVRMQSNFKIDPLLDTFDMLELQEISMRIRHINMKHRLKQRRSLETGIVRRGGKQAKRYKNQLYDFFMPKVMDYARSQVNPDYESMANIPGCEEGPDHHFDDLQSNHSVGAHSMTLQHRNTTNNLNTTRKTSRPPRSISKFEKQKMAERIETLLGLKARQDFFDGPRAYGPQPVYGRFRIYDEMNARPLQVIVNRRDINETEQQMLNMQGEVLQSQRSSHRSKKNPLPKTTSEEIPKSGFAPQLLNKFLSIQPEDPNPLIKKQGGELTLEKLGAQAGANSFLNYELRLLSKKPLRDQLCQIFLTMVRREVGLVVTRQQSSSQISARVKGKLPQQHKKKKMLNEQQLERLYNQMILIIQKQGQKKSQKHTHLVNPQANGKQINWDPVMEHDHRYYNQKMNKKLIKNEKYRIKKGDYGRVDGDNDTDRSSVVSSGAGKESMQILDKVKYELKSQKSFKPSLKQTKNSQRDNTIPELKRKQTHATEFTAFDGDLLITGVQRGNKKTGNKEDKNTEFALGGSFIVGRKISFESFGTISEHQDDSDELGSMGAGSDKDDNELIDDDMSAQSQSKRLSDTKMTPKGSQKSAAQYSGLFNAADKNKDPQLLFAVSRTKKHAELVKAAQEDKSNTYYGDAIRGKQYKMFDFLEKDVQQEVKMKDKRAGSALQNSTQKNHRLSKLPQLPSENYQLYGQFEEAENNTYSQQQQVQSQMKSQSMTASPSKLYTRRTSRKDGNTSRSKMFSGRSNNQDKGTNRVNKSNFNLLENESAASSQVSYSNISPEEKMRRREERKMEKERRASASGQAGGKKGACDCFDTSSCTIM